MIKFKHIFFNIAAEFKSFYSIYIILIAVILGGVIIGTFFPAIIEEPYLELIQNYISDYSDSLSLSNELKTQCLYGLGINTIIFFLLLLAGFLYYGRIIILLISFFKAFSIGFSFVFLKNITLNLPTYIGVFFVLYNIFIILMMLRAGRESWHLSAVGFWPGLASSPQIKGLLKLYWVLFICSCVITVVYIIIVCFLADMIFMFSQMSL